LSWPGPQPVVARDDCFAGFWAGVEQAVRCLDDARAGRCRDARPGVEESGAVEIFAGCDVERRARLHRDVGAEADIPAEVDGAGDEGARRMLTRPRDLPRRMTWANSGSLRRVRIVRTETPNHEAISFSLHCSEQSFSSSFRSMEAALRPAPSRRENRVIELLYDLGWQSREVATELHVNESRVSQIKQGAISKLRLQLEPGSSRRAA